MLISFILRVGLAIVFLYAAISSFLVPESWVGFFPAWMRDMMPANYLLMLFSLYELALALWLLSGKKAFSAAIFSAMTLAAIITTNLTLLDIVFRDVAILFMAIALVMLSKK